MLKLELEYAGPKTTAAYSLAPAYSGPGDSVGQLGSRLSDMQEELRQTEQEIRLIETAVDMLSEPKAMIINQKYLQGNKDTYVSRMLHKYGLRSMDSYYRLKDEAVEELAKLFGMKKGE